MATQIFLVYGANGYIGSSIVDALTQGGYKYHAGKSRLDNLDDIRKEVETIKPTHLICAAGLKGTPNIDWFEKPENKEYGYKINVAAQVAIAKICLENNVHCALISTGSHCNYDDAHAPGTGIGFTEEERPNYDKLVYSQQRIELEDLLKPLLDKTLVVRLFYPLASKENPGNLLTKIHSFPKVHDLPSSMTSLDDMCPLLIKMCIRQTPGIFNFTNPGVISPNQILQLYKQEVNPDQSWEISPAPTNRPSCYLDTTKLETLFPGERKPIHEAIKEIFQAKAAKMKSEKA